MEGGRERGGKEDKAAHSQGTKAEGEETKRPVGRFGPSRKTYIMISIDTTQ